MLHSGDVFALGRVFCRIVDYPGGHGDVDLADVAPQLPGMVTIDSIFAGRLERLRAEAK